jgi:hypothetical protein
MSQLDLEDTPPADRLKKYFGVKRESNAPFYVEFTISFLPSKRSKLP